MWYPVEIEFGGLFAFRDKAKVVFRQRECTVIFGDNQTDRGVINNGAGKSTLFEAISLALTGDLLPRDTPITRDKAINRDSDDAWVNMKLENSVLHQCIEIKRRFFRKKSAKATLIINGKPQNELVSVADVDKRVLDLLGVTKDDLLKYYIISQDRQYNFLTAPDAVKKEILNRITNADMLQPMLDSIKNDRKAAEEQVSKYELEIAKLNTRIETLKENMREILETNDTATLIESLKESMTYAEKTVCDINNRIESSKEELGEYSKKRNKLLKQLDESEDLETKIAVVQEDVDEAKRMRNSQRRSKEHLELLLAGSVTCPNCGEEFVPNSDANLTTIPDIEAAIKKCTDLEVDYSNKLKGVQAELDELEEKRAEFKQLRRDLRNTENYIQELTDNIEKYEARIESEQRRISQIKDKIKKANEKNQNDASVKAIKAKIKTAKEELSMLESEIEDFRYLAESLAFWDFNMGKNGFLTFLANKSIKTIEGMTNVYLEKFGLDVSVLINGFTTTKDGSVRDKIDVYIQSDGLNADAYGIHSGAERGRVALAALIALNRLINMSTNGKGLDMLLLDEAFHGIDSLGQENIIRALERVGITSMMITQNVSAEFAAKNKLTVRKIDKVSRYD